MEEAPARRVGDAVVQDVDHDDGHVVGAAGGERGGHEVVGRLLGRGARDRERLDLCVRDHRRESVGAQDDAVAVVDLEREVVGVHVGV